MVHGSLADWMSDQNSGTIQKEFLYNIIEIVDYVSSATYQLFIAAEADECRILSEIHSRTDFVCLLERHSHSHSAGLVYFYITLLYRATIG